MELIPDQWSIFFPKPEDLARAHAPSSWRILLKRCPGLRLIDKFQHWVWRTPGPYAEAEKGTMECNLQEFSDTVTDWRGLEEARDYLHGKSNCTCRSSFYYIEYGMAQIGAIAGRNFKNDPKKGLAGYMNALKAR